MNMKIKSLRFRLIYWYFTAFFLSTVIIFSIFYYVTKGVISDQTDKEIALHATKITDVIASESVGIHGIFPKLQLEREFSQMPGMLIVISDNAGKIQSSSQPVEPEKQNLSNILQKSANIINPVFLNIKIGTSLMRSGIFSITRENGEKNLVLVAHPVEAVQKSLNSLIWIFIWTMIIVAMLSIIGGVIIARGALYPIAVFSGQLKKIESTSLDLRVVNPKTGDEIEELAVAFNLLLERLHKSFEREQQFIEDMAHELKTPLSIMKNTVEVVLSKKRSENEYKQSLNSALVDINKLSVTVNDVLDLAWTKSDAKIMISEEVNLTDLMKEMEEILQKMSVNKKISLKIHLADNIFIRGEKQKLQRAYFNLIDNAVKYTPVKGIITLLLNKTGNNAEVEISNTGPGIKQEELPMIFNRFYRGSKTAREFGSGLGLAICKFIIEAHNGSLSVESIVNKKTTVKVILPLAI